MDSIAPLTARTSSLIRLLAVIAVVGGGATLAILGRGVTTAIDSRALAGTATMLFAGALGVAYLLLWQRNARLLIGPGTFGIQDLLGRRHTWSASEVSKVVDVTLSYSRSWSQRAVFVIGIDGRRLLAVNPIAWSPEAIDSLTRATGKTLDIRQQPMRAADFRHEFPRAMSWATVHSTLMGGALAIAMIVLAIGIPIALGLMHR